MSPQRGCIVEQSSRQGEEGQESVKITRDCNHMRARKLESCPLQRVQHRYLGAASAGSTNNSSTKNRIVPDPNARRALCLLLLLAKRSERSGRSRLRARMMLLTTWLSCNIFLSFDFLCRHEMNLFPTGPADKIYFPGPKSFETQTVRSVTRSRSEIIQNATK